MPIESFFGTGEVSGKPHRIAVVEEACGSALRRIWRRHVGGRVRPRLRRIGGAVPGLPHQ